MAARVAARVTAKVTVKVTAKMAVKVAVKVAGRVAAKVAVKVSLTAPAEVSARGRPPSVAEPSRLAEAEVPLETILETASSGGTGSCSDT